jgi:hypothetical protein
MQVRHSRRHSCELFLGFAALHGGDSLFVVFLELCEHVNLLVKHYAAYTIATHCTHYTHLCGL